MTGSTAFPAEIARQLEKMCGVRMMASYGATEYTQNVAQPPRDGDPRYGSAGLRLPYTQIKIVDIDDAGRIVREHGVDEIGLVVVKGPSVTPGYVDEAANQGILLPDGWFNSGDLGRIDADGYLWITGRAKDIIIRGGHNIDPTVIEETLHKHPQVALAAAVSMPDSYAGELPIAYVELVPNATATAEEVQAFALAHSPERAAAPKQIILLDKMPLTDVGKPAKVQLRLDAARRAFTAALADVTGHAGVSVDMVADARQGNRAVIRVAAPAGARRNEIEDRIREEMKYYRDALRDHLGRLGRRAFSNLIADVVIASSAQARRGNCANLHRHARACRGHPRLGTKVRRGCIGLGSAKSVKQKSAASRVNPTCGRHRRAMGEQSDAVLWRLCPAMTTVDSVQVKTVRGSGPIN